MRKIGSCGVALLALASASCGNGLCDVSGRVTYRGEPATGAAVFFQRQSIDPTNEPMIMGIVQDDGSFSLVCGAQGKGAPPGEYDVLIEWKPRSRRATGANVRSSDRLKGRYADPQRPLLHAAVNGSRTILPPFELVD